MRLALFAVAMLLALPACSLLTAAKMSWADPELPAGDTGPLAAAMAHILAERFTPGKTTSAIVEAPEGHAYPL